MIASSVSLFYSYFDHAKQCFILLIDIEASPNPALALGADGRTAPADVPGRLDRQFHCSFTAYNTSISVCVPVFPVRLTSPPSPRVRIYPHLTLAQPPSPQPHLDLSSPHIGKIFPHLSKNFLKIKNFLSILVK